MRLFTTGVLLLIALTVKGWADTTDVESPVDTTNQIEDPFETTPAIPSDTLLFLPTLDTGAAVQVTDSTQYEQRLTQNPTTALFKSMFVPGLGQIGNRKYIKAGIFIGLEVWFIGAAIHHGQKANHYYNKWEETPIEDFDTKNAYYGQYVDRRDNRNQFIWLAALTIFVSMFDAYVDAHLSGGPTERESDAVSFDIGPDNSGGVEAALTYSF
jgi:hypothetical protein